MRQFKFRGKSKDSGQWVFGSYHYCKGTGKMRHFKWEKGNRAYEDQPTQFSSHWILTHHTPDSVGWDIRDTFYPVEVIPETVGICIGSLNEKELYTNDIVETRFGPRVIYWSDKFYAFVYDQPVMNYLRTDQFLLYNLAPDSKIIGNIYENPELLKS